MIKLLIAIKKKGINIDDIYNHDVISNQEDELDESKFLIKKPSKSNTLFKKKKSKSMKEPILDIDFADNSSKINLYNYFWF